MAGVDFCKNKSCDREKVVVRNRSAYFTTMRTEKSSFKWTIECFSRINAAVGTPKASPLFPGDADEGKSKWILIFYPSGENDEKKDHIGLRLMSVTSHGRDVTVDLDLRLRDSNERELCCRRDDRKIIGHNSYVWEQLPKIEHIKKILEDDIIVIDLNIMSTVEEVNRYHDPEPPSPRLRLVDSFAELRRSGKLCDATVLIGTTRIPVHSVVLAARSSVFMAMFEHSTKEKQSGVVEIEDIDCKTLQYLLDFIYSCELPNFNVPLAMNLLKAADKYDLSDLKEHCISYLAISLNTSNVAEILLLANTYSANGLKDRAIEYICLNKTRFSEIDGYNIILKEEPCILADILHKMSFSA